MMDGNLICQKCDLKFPNLSSLERHTKRFCSFVGNGNGNGGFTNKNDGYKLVKVNKHIFSFISTGTTKHKN